MISCLILFVFFFKQKTAYEMRISDWSSDVCSSDLLARQRGEARDPQADWFDPVRPAALLGTGGASFRQLHPVSSRKGEAARERMGTPSRPVISIPGRATDQADAACHRDDRH